MLSALSDAGQRMQQRNKEVCQGYLCAFNAHMDDPCDAEKEEKFNRLEAAAHEAVVHVAEYEAVVLGPRLRDPHAGIRT